MHHASLSLPSPPFPSLTPLPSPSLPSPPPCSSQPTTHPEEVQCLVPLLGQHCQQGVPHVLVPCLLLWLHWGCLLLLPLCGRLFTVHLWVAERWCLIYLLTLIHRLQTRYSLLHLPLLPALPHHSPSLLLCCRQWSPVLWSVLMVLWELA